MKISDILCNDIENVLDEFELKYYEGITNRGNKYYYFCCPIHGSDKNTSLLLYPDGHTHRGFWQCLTRGCQNNFQPTIIGFIRGVLSHKKYGWESKNDKYESFNDTLNFISKTFKIDFNNIDIDNDYLEKKRFLSQTNWSVPMAKNKPLIHRNEVVKRLGKCPKYFLKRGFSEEILKKYDVGYCDDPKKAMYQRCVVPIYDQGYNYLVGCQGRSIFEVCDKCDGYHDPYGKCAEYPKWKNSENFNKKDSLYNYWFSREYMKLSKTAILVESCGNVWRLEEAGVKNSVGLYGGQFSDGQQFLIDQAGVMNIIVIMDADKAGSEHEKKIIEQTKDFYNVRAIHINSGDIADMSIQEIRTNIVPFL